MERNATGPSEPLNPPQRLLMGPGPSNVHPRVYRALSTPIVGHLDPEFLAIMDRTQDMLRHVFGTQNCLTLSISGTGSSGMEAALVNSVETGDTVLVCINGVFGTRIADIVERIGGKLITVERPWGEVFSPDEIKSSLASNPDIKIVAIVHAETSTGAHQPLAEIGKLCQNHDALLLVDAVTSLGGEEVLVDDWGIDICYSGTQKCLSCPPGLAPITFSDRAVEKLSSRKEKVVSWYLDLNMIVNYWTEGSRAYHHTAPISMNFALHEALALVIEEGLTNRRDRHRLNSRALASGLEALGFRMFAQEGHRLAMLNSVWIPEGIPDAEVRKRLLLGYNLEIGAGLAKFAGKIWRIGLMGETSRRENVIFFLSALETILRDVDFTKSIGASIEAANEVYSH